MLLLGLGVVVRTVPLVEALDDAEEFEEDKLGDPEAGGGMRAEGVDGDLGGDVGAAARLV